MRVLLTLVVLAILGAAGAARAQPASVSPAPGATISPVPGITVTLVPAPPIRLYDERLWRADSNSPVHVHAGRVFAFVSHWQPVGHFFRRVGAPGLEFRALMEPTRILNDPDPTAGKWLESTWRDPDGRLYGWYHAEVVAPCPRDLKLQHAGAMVSDDDGLSWRIIGELLQELPESYDCDYRNGANAGGYGDFTVVPDRAQRWFYIHYSSYLPDETAQGIGVARYPVVRRGAPNHAMELWTGAGWAPATQAKLRPLWPPSRGWRHPDPAAFWGPAVHYNRALGQYVMLLNRTEGGKGDWRQEGIYVSLNPDLADPARWSPPVRIIAGGDWYPQVIGLEPGDSDTEAGAIARFFMAGRSAWEIRFACTAAATGARTGLLRGAQAGTDAALRLPAAAGRRATP